MSYSPVSMARRHVLGELYSRCEAIVDDIPVYMDGEERALLGHVNEALGHYADAFSFHVGDDVCRKLAAGYYVYKFDYDLVGGTSHASRLKLNSITLIGRTGYAKPMPRRSARV